MAGTKRDRQKALRQAKLARQAAVAQARARRRRALGGALGAAALVLVVVLVVVSRGDSSRVTTTETTVPADDLDLPSAAGKPCVPVADPLPPGAPAVPVKVGPPPTQLIIEDLKEGTGAAVNPTDTVTVNYIGVSCSSGKIFDSSYEGGKPATFPLNQVIKGWTEGIPNMKVGGQRLLGIPPEKAYGEESQPPSIAANETLWFVVEMIEAKPA